MFLKLIFHSLPDISGLDIQLSQSFICHLFEHGVKFQILAIVACRKVQIAKNCDKRAIQQSELPTNAPLSFQQECLIHGCHQDFNFVSQR